MDPSHTHQVPFISDCGSFRTSTGKHVDALTLRECTQMSLGPAPETADYKTTGRRQTAQLDFIAHVKTERYCARAYVLLSIGLHPVHLVEDQIEIVLIVGYFHILHIRYQNIRNEACHKHYFVWSS
jgi:hypothetical protein